MLRVVLLVLLATVVARAFWRIVGGVVEGITGGRPGDRAPARGIQMVRDPVCGAFVVPDRAVALDDHRARRGRERLYFCSDRCRDAYRARTA
jgi:YHS domain-containing protein